MGMTAKQLIAMLASDGWQKTEKKLDAEGFDGSYTADDVIACAKFCWGVPDRIVKHRPEIIKQFASRDIIDIAGAGRSGLAALRAIFKSNAEDAPELYLAKDQLETLFNHLRTVPQGITMSDHHRINPKLHQKCFIG